MRIVFGQRSRFGTWTNSQAEASSARSLGLNQLSTHQHEMGFGPEPPFVQSAAKVRSQAIAAHEGLSPTPELGAARGKH